MYVTQTTTTTIPPPDRQEGMIACQYTTEPLQVENNNSIRQKVLFFSLVENVNSRKETIQKLSVPNRILIDSLLVLL